MHWIAHTVRYFLVHWGYWAVLAALLAEDAGLPVPGETTLMFASFLAHKHTSLHVMWVIVVGIAAAIVGDNIGFLLGRKFGRTLIRWMKKLLHLDDTDVGAAKNLIRTRGAETIFFARFIFGLRTVAGPLAGMLGMEWRQFVIFNALGAAAWVTSMALAGYLFASEFQTLVEYFEYAGWAMAAGLFTVGYVLWRRHKKHYEEEQGEKAA